MTPKEYKEMMAYLTRSGVRKQVKFASDIGKPVDKFEVQQIKLFNEFNTRNPRTGKAGGGMLVQPGFGGTRQGYKEDRGKGKYKRDSLSKIEQKKIKDAFPDTKFDFDKHRYGVKKYPTGNQNVTSKDYTKVIRFIKKGFTTEMGEGLTARGTKYKTRGERLSLQDQEKIKSLFKLPPGEEWDFKTHKYGIKQLGRENLLVRMARAVKDKKPWKVAADFGSTEGWMILQMNRVFENETKAGVKPNKLTYQPVYKIINDRKRIIGFKDNTVAGGGKYYYALNRHAKKNATSFVNHGDFKLNQKLVDISKRSLNQPNEVITGLLKDKGFTGKVNLNQLINFLSGTEATSAELLKNAVVRHHNSGVAFGSATNDLSLTIQTINTKIRNAEANIRQGNILKEDIQLLKNNNIFVRGKDGKLYGSGAKTPIGQFKQIEKSVETALQEGVDFKGKKFSDTQLKTFLQKVAMLGGGDCGRIRNYQGGRIGLQDGTPNVDVCFRNATNRINSGFKNATPAEARNYTKLLNAVKGSAVIGKNLLKFGIVPEALYVGADTLVRMGYGDTFKEAGLRAADFFIPGDQTQEADRLKVQRTLGDAAAINVGRVFDYRNQIANIDSLEQQKQNFENLSDVGEFDYIGDLSQDIKNIDTRLNQAKNDLQNKFMVSEAETVAADRALEEAYDISKAKSPLARLKSFAQNIEAVQDDPFLSDIATPQKTQMDLNLNILPTLPTNIMQLKTLDAINLAQQLRAEGQDVSAKDVLAYRDQLKGMPLMDAANQFGREQVFGTQGTFFGQPLAGGGIAKLAGVDSGPPPEKGPNSQGLQGLMKRVRNL